MADEPKAANGAMINLADPKVLAIIAALVGSPFFASKLSVSGIESQQQRTTDTAQAAVEKQISIDSTLRDMKVSQDRAAESQAKVEAAVKDMQVSQNRAALDVSQFQGEVRYRLEQVEKRVAEIPQKVEEKGKR